MRLRHEDLLEDESQILRVEDEAGTNRRALHLRLQRHLRRKARNTCRRKNQGEHRHDGTVPGPRPPQPETIRRSHMLLLN